MGDIIGDINSRRGRILGMTPQLNARVINGYVPLSCMFGYVSTLRSMSQGRAIYSMTFDHYAEVPKSIVEKLKPAESVRP